MLDRINNLLNKQKDKPEPSEPYHAAGQQSSPRAQSEAGSQFEWNSKRYNPNRSVNRQGCLRVAFFLVSCIALVGIIIVGSLYWSMGRNLVVDLWQRYEPPEPTATLDLDSLLVMSPTPNPTATPLQAWEMTTEALAIATREPPKLISTKTPTPVTPTATLIPRAATDTPTPIPNATPTERVFGILNATSELPVLATAEPTFDPEIYRCNHSGEGQPPSWCRD